MFLIVLFVLVMMGCAGGGAESPAQGTGGEGPGGAGGASSTSVASSSSSTGGGGGAAPVPLCGSRTLEPWDCGPTYPDPLLAYDPAAGPGTLFAAAPGESPEGAAAGRIDAQSGHVVAVHVGFGTIPDVVHVGVWQEPSCGLPSSAAVPMQDVDAAAITTTGRLTRLPLSAPVELRPEAGHTWLAVGLTSGAMSVGSLATLAGEHEPRFAWLGLADLDCDGSNDSALGWEDIRTPSAIGVDSAYVDLVIGAELAP